MLYDPRHDKTPNIPGFALFCASKPVDEKYNWMNCRDCAVGQYLHSIGIEPTAFVWKDDLGIMNTIARGGEPVDAIFGAEAWTFGKCAERVLAYQMSNEKV